MFSRIIAIDTSEQPGTIAALEASQETTALKSHTLCAGQRTAQSLVPALQKLLSDCDWLPSDVQLVCVTTGPGSFTGLRIGVTAAKTFAYAAGAKAAGVSTLATIAAQTESTDRAIWAVLGAQRGELFCARFESTDDAVARCDPAREDAHIFSVDAWLAQLKPGEVIAGPPLSRLSNQLPTGVAAANEIVWQPRAETVGRLGYWLMQSGNTTDPMQLLPHYIRRSAAEEKADRQRR